jgi:hypothetical protein
MLRHYGHPVLRTVEKNIVSFLIHFLHLKLLFMSNANTIKDAARSGLSRYTLIIKETLNYTS